MAEGNANSGSGDPSHNPRDLSQLLRFCTELTKREDPTHETNLPELTEERKKFLESVFNSLQGGDLKFMAECLEKLSRDSVNIAEDVVTEQETALDHLSDYTEDINYANDINSLNGFPIIVNCLHSPHNSIQQGAAQVIGNICQNNETCQKYMMEYNIIPLLLNILDTHSDSGCRVKALYALSCMVREYEPAEKLFVESSGLSYLMKAIQTKNSRLIMKSVFLLNHFIEKDGKYKDVVLVMGFVEQFIIVLFDENISTDCREYCYRSLYKLCLSTKSALSECLRPEFEFVEQLKKRQNNISGKEEYRDEEKYIDLLLKLFETTEDDDEVTCR